MYNLRKIFLDSKYSLALQTSKIFNGLTLFSLVYFLREENKQKLRVNVVNFMLFGG